MFVCLFSASAKLLLFNYVLYIVFSRPTSFLQKSSRRVSSEKNILNSSLESCGLWSRVVSCRVMLRKVYFPTHVLFIINAYAELSRSRRIITLKHSFGFPKICLLSILSYEARMIMYARALYRSFKMK